MPQGRTRVIITGAVHRPVRKPLLRLTGPAPDAASIKREIGELEDRLFALRAKLAAIEGPRRTAPKARRSAPAAPPAG